MEFRKFSAATGSFNVYEDGSKEGQIHDDLASNRNSETAVKINQIHENVGSDLNSHFDRMVKNHGNEQ